MNQSVLAKYEGQIFTHMDEEDPRHYLVENCRQLFATTAVLSEEPLIFPEQVGITIDPDISYFLLTAHLPNPTDQELTVSVSLKIWTTSEKFILTTILINFLKIQDKIENTKQAFRSFCLQSVSSTATGE